MYGNIISFQFAFIIFIQSDLDVLEGLINDNLSNTVTAVCTVADGSTVTVRLNSPHHCITGMSANVCIMYSDFDIFKY